jgi:ankyrin repeat protein
VVKLLLKHEADVDLVNKAHGSALAYAALQDQDICDKYIQSLLEAGADVNIQGGKYGCLLGVSTRTVPELLYLTSVQNLSSPSRHMSWLTI